MIAFIILCAAAVAMTAVLLRVEARAARRRALVAWAEWWPAVEESRGRHPSANPGPWRCEHCGRTVAFTEAAMDLHQAVEHGVIL